MERARVGPGWLAALVLLWGATLPAQPAAAQEAQPGAEAEAAPPEDPLIDPRAVEPVRRMVQALTSADALSFTAVQEYDAIQDDGEAIEFGSRQQQTVRRPDRMRTERWDRDGRHLQAFYDGKAVTVYEAERKVYATAERAGDLEALTDFLREEVGLRLPLADLLSEDLRALLLDNVIAARSVGRDVLDGVPTEHVALRTREGVGVQLWIRDGEEAVPQRIVMTFETARGRPQFRADFSDWDLSPRTPDRLFAFRPPRDAKQVPFVLPVRGTQPAQEGGL
jgi:hypothetical protein